MTSQFQSPAAASLPGAPAPSGHTQLRCGPGAVGVMGITGQSEQESVTSPQGGNAVASGWHDVAGKGTGGARVSPVPDAMIISAFRHGLDSVDIATMFDVPESAVWSALSRKTPK